uniref:Uncharacterized protein n=1 Tax=Arundo donax TaxID=35708 RepID=A0A0A8Z6X2_ARUDO
MAIALISNTRVSRLEQIRFSRQP